MIPADTSGINAQQPASQDACGGGVDAWLGRGRHPLVLLLAVLCLFFVPALLLRAPLFCGDSAQEYFPKLVGVARQVQQGSFPLWDGATFCGARPFYAMLETPIYYLPLYPFFFLADTDNLTGSYYVLFLLPILLHLLLAGTGCYLLGRRGLRLGAGGAWLMGLAYALGPHMTGVLGGVLETFSVAWIPWVLLSVCLVFRTGRARYGLAGVLSLVMMLSAVDVKLLIRHGLVVALFALTVWLFFHARKPQAARRLWVVAGIFIGAIGITAVIWVGVLEGVSWEAGIRPLGYDLAARSTLDASLHPLYLVTLLIPDFFGNVSGHPLWGVGYLQDTYALLTGGFVVSFCAMLALAALFRCDTPPDRRRWTWIAVLLLGVGLVLMMGRYTPVYRLLCALFPWFFGIPFPVYYRFLPCLGLVLLLGLGADAWLSGRFEKARWVGAYLTGVFLLGCGALLWPLSVGEKVLASWRSMTAQGLQREFLAGPVLYAAIAGGVLAATVLLARRRDLRRSLFFALVLADILFLGGYLTYHTPPGPIRGEPDGHQSVFLKRYQSPNAHPYYRAVSTIQKVTSGDDSRVVGSVTLLDNQAWVAGRRAAMGCSSKPLMPRMREVLERFMENMPYEMWTSAYPPRFLQNMNVGHLLVLESTVAADGPAAPDVIPIEGTLPYLYTQPRLVALDEEAQVKWLLEHDVREAAGVASADLFGIMAQGWAGSGALHASAQSDRIRNVTRHGANQLTLEADIETGAMLVRVETWHPGWRVYVDGQERPLWHVNYLQQGVYLNPGRHKVAFRFFPPQMRWGLGISVLSFIAVVAMALWHWRREGRAC